MSLPLLLVIAGPTASGKSSRAIELAKELNGEIVSADSRQIYRGMDIGTAKPKWDNPANIKYQISNIKSEKETSALPNWKLEIGNWKFSEGIPHHLIDIRDIGEPYTVADFQRDAFVVIDDIISRGKTPILCGGTGLYIRAITENLSFPPHHSSPKSDTSYMTYMTDKTNESALEQLISLDPDAAHTVDLKNPRRVARALEATLETGIPWSKQQAKNPPRYEPEITFLNPPANELRERINARVDEMFASGLVDEVRHLIPDISTYQHIDILDSTIGYKEVIDYLQNKITLEQAKADIKLNTWHYAKRQITWFKKYLTPATAESMEVEPQ